MVYLAHLKSWSVTGSKSVSLRWNLFKASSIYANCLWKRGWYNASRYYGGQNEMATEAKFYISLWDHKKKTGLVITRQTLHINERWENSYNMLSYPSEVVARVLKENENWDYNTWLN
jgi:hypothetical protein